MTKTSFDRSILVPIGIGTFSVLGICLVLLTGYLGQPQANIPAGQTTTPFKYLFLGTETFATEPELKTSTPEELFKEASTASGPPSAIMTPTKISSTQGQTTDASIGIPTQVQTNVASTGIATQTNTITSNNTPGSTPTPTFDATKAFTAGKYDDTAPLLDYAGDWVNELYVTGAYQETIYLSLEIAGTVKFKFIGKQIIVGYLGDTDFGTVAITIDNVQYVLDQSIGSEWVSPQLTPGGHSVIIRHESGDLANLDYINILE